MNELQADSSTHKNSEIKQLKALINKQQAAFNRQRQLIDAQGKQIQELISQVKILSNNTSTDKTGAPPRDKPRTIKSVKASDPKPIKPVGKKPPLKIRETER
jgi:hypothetical protein